MTKQELNSLNKIINDVSEYLDYYEFIDSKWIDDRIAKKDWTANHTWNIFCALQNAREQLEQLSTGEKL